MSSKRDRLAQFAGAAVDRAPALTFSLVATPGEYRNQRALMIAVGRIRPNPRNPRKTFSAASLDELAASIQAQGMLNPITVRREGEEYVVVAGDRRYRAALQIGLAEVPCIVVELDAEQAYIAALIENLQREDLTPAEEAEALAELVVQRGLSVREVARLVHKDSTAVSRKVRIAQDPELLTAVAAGASVTAVERLLGVTDRERRRTLLDGLVQGTLRIADVNRALEPAPTPQPAPVEPRATTPQRAPLEPTADGPTVEVPVRSAAAAPREDSPARIIGAAAHRPADQRGGADAGAPVSGRSETVDVPPAPADVQTGTDAKSEPSRHLAASATPDERLEALQRALDGFANASVEARNAVELVLASAVALPSDVLARIDGELAAWAQVRARVAAPALPTPPVGAQPVS